MLRALSCRGSSRLWLTSDRSVVEIRHFLERRRLKAPIRHLVGSLYVAEISADQAKAHRLAFTGLPRFDWGQVLAVYSSLLGRFARVKHPSAIAPNDKWELLDQAKRHLALERGI